MVSVMGTLLHNVECVGMQSHEHHGAPRAMSNIESATQAAAVPIGGCSFHVLSALNEISDKSFRRRINKSGGFCAFVSSVIASSHHSLRATILWRVLLIVPNQASTRLPRGSIPSIFWALSLLLYTCSRRASETHVDDDAMIGASARHASSLSASTLSMGREGGLSVVRMHCSQI